MRQSPEKKLERERVRMTLMRATLDLAESHGFSSLGLREISREAGIAPTSFYRHFADVEELGLGIIDRLVAPMLAGVTSAAADAEEGGEDPVAAVVDGLLQATVDDPALVRFALAQYLGAHGSLRRSLRSQFGELVEALSRCAAEGAPRATASAALAGILLGCDALLESEADERKDVHTGLRLSVTHTARWVLRCSKRGEGSHG